MEWVSVNDRYPLDGQPVKIKIWDSKNECECVVEARFKDCEYYRSWIISEESYEGKNLIAKPTYWMPLPAPPKD